MGVPTTTLPLGALHTLVLTAGPVPETQRSPQTTPPRELLTPGSGENTGDRVRHGHGQAALQQARVFPPPKARSAPQGRGRLGLLTHIHGANALTQPVGEEREADVVSISEAWDRGHRGPS